MGKPLVPRNWSLNVTRDANKFVRKQFTGGDFSGRDTPKASVNAKRKSRITLAPNPFRKPE